MNEFEQLQRIWDSQNNQPIYIMNEQALHQRIETKKNKTIRITNFTELLLIFVNLFSGVMILTIKFPEASAVYMTIMALWMLITAAYALVSRVRRINGNSKFDRSMQGDLAFAISVASYQVRLSKLMRWNVLPIGILCFLGLLSGGKSVSIIVIMTFVFAALYYFSGWEHSFYESRKRELETLQGKLKSEG